MPRSDYQTIIRGDDIDDYGLTGAQVNEFRADRMLYAPYWGKRESPYGFPPVEQALLPIISGLQKQEFQLDYFREGTVPAVYISPGDPNLSPTQLGELQSAFNAFAGDPAYHQKVMVLPPNSRVDPQRPVDLSDSFDLLVQTQVCMMFDVQPIEIGLLPNIGGMSGSAGASASGVRFAAQEKRDIKSRVSAKPLLKWLCSIFNIVIQDICDCPDMQFEFAGLVDDEDKQAITQLGVEQIQNGISSIDEVRERLDLPPWGLQETSEPIVMTQNGPVPFSMAPQLLQAALAGGTGPENNSKQPAVKPRRGTAPAKPNGSHPAPLSPSRPAITPAHEAASALIQRPQPGRTGGTPSRSPVAGSRKRGEGHTPTQGRLRNKAAAELDNLRRHLRKGMAITEWDPVAIDNGILRMVAEDMAKGVLIDVAIARAETFLDKRYITAGEAREAVRTGEFPGWQRDLALVDEFQGKISQAFLNAEYAVSQIRKNVARGTMFASPGVMDGMISDVMKEIFTETLTPLWEQAWDLGYDSAARLAGPGSAISPESKAEARRVFAAAEGEHWLGEISRTGLGNSGARSMLIARTETARAMNAGAEECYRDRGFSHKHLLVAPDDRSCETCADAADDGIIPLDAGYSAPGLEPPFHPGCRCISAPAGIELDPPLTSIKAEDRSRLAWLLLRARDEDGKWRFLLQQRDSGKWGMPGGSTHEGEDPWKAAVREVTEEIGDLPPLRKIRTFHHVEDDGETQVYLWLCEVPYFTPKLNGATPEETQGAAWFRKKEIGDLDLVSPFREDWESSIALRDHVTKASRAVDENGTVLLLDDEDASNYGAGLGARYPYPHRADGAEVPGGTAGEEDDWGVTKPRLDGMSDLTETRIYPRGSDDSGFPRRRTRNRPAKSVPDTPGAGQYPAHAEPSRQAPGSTQGARTGTIKQHPVTGIAPPQTPHPKTPHPDQPEPYDPADAVVHETSEGNVVMDDSATQVAVKGGAADYHDPNPVEAEHVYLLMSKNFPPEAIQWVKRARWTGPIQVPWDRVDTDNKKSWAASHQPGKVKEFEQAIQAHKGHVAPSILIQEPNSNRAVIVDGHHRALAHENLGQKILAYLGNIDPEDRQAALETHSKQIHQGSDPENK